MADLGDAPALAASLLDAAGLQRRWAHTQAVAGRARRLAVTVNATDRDLLTGAAWLHDIGYSPLLVRTGMHSLDGARHLEALGYPGRLCALVAHHSGARFEAAQRGLTNDIDHFLYEDSPVADALTAADLTTGPDGQTLTARQRITEILTRYPPDNPVHQAVTVARPALIEQVRRALHRLSQSTAVAREDG